MYLSYQAPYLRQFIISTTGYNLAFNGEIDLGMLNIRIPKRSVPLDEDKKVSMASEATPDEDFGKTSAPGLTLEAEDQEGPRRLSKSPTPISRRSSEIRGT